MTEEVIAVVPAYNEETTIGSVIRDISEYVGKIIVVDDGSVDNTASVAKDGGAIVVSNPENQGYETSIENGFKRALQEGADVIITLDADGQHDPSEIPRMVKPILNGDADVVVGRRPHVQRTSERLFRPVSRRLIGIDDPLCGFKAYRSTVFQEVGFFDRCNSVGTQLMFEAERRGFSLTQVNVSLREREDDPRFGRRIDANWRIFRAMLAITRRYH